MSTVMRPRGRLPARIYWTRRLLLLAVVVVVAALLWWLVPGGGGSGAASADPGRRTSTGPTHTTTTARPPTTSETTTRQPKPPARTTAAPALSTPTGPCDPATVKLVVAVKDATEGAGTKVGLRMSTTDQSTCSLGITPSVLELRITRETDIVWQSTSCPDGLAAKNVVVRPQPAVVYSFAWDGRDSPDACSTSGPVGKPGTYSAAAALIGGVPSTVQFLVTAAEPTEPTPTDPTGSPPA